jgi:MFS transporter, SHS family, lactate transporter
MSLAGLRGWSATQKNVVAAAYLGWTLDAFDFLLITLITRDIAEEFHVKATALGLVITATLALRPLGAFVFGRLADRFGRKPILMIVVLAYSSLAFASAFAPNFASFLALRCLFGVAMGGEWGVGSALAMEHARADSRGFVSGVLQAGYPSGALLAAGAAALLLPSFGWRALIMASAIPALLVLFVRARVPESPAFAQAAPRRDTLAIARKHWRIGLFAILMMASFNALSHGTQDFYANFLRIQHGYDPRLASLIIMAGSFGAIVGGITFGALSQSIGRRRAITISALLVLPAIPFWAFLSHAPWMFAVSVFALQFMVQGAWGVAPAHLNELSPAEARGTFPGFVYQFGNLLSAAVPYGQAFLVEERHWSYGQALALVAACAAVLIGVIVNLGPEARHATMAREG